MARRLAVNQLICRFDPYSWSKNLEEVWATGGQLLVEQPYEGSNPFISATDPSALPALLRRDRR
jgi:hypothetical protein